MRFFRLSALLAAFFMVAAPAGAEVQSSSPQAFFIQGEATTTASAGAVWRELAHPERWWSSAHTYSGSARNLRLDRRAGGCWCERWGDGHSVEHARVLLVMESQGVRTLRVAGALGPLQEMGAAGILTFTVAPQGDGARIGMTYRIEGNPGLSLDQLAPIVDTVLMEQLARLARLADTGSPQ